MADDPAPQCAVWYFRRGGHYFELFEDEEEAVTFADAVDDDDDSIVEGVQFADGHTHERDKWPGLAAYQARREALAAERRKTEPPRPDPVRLRDVRSPFCKNVVGVWDVDEAPDWIGLPYP
jgi:hypothetical protein